jgi:lipopolysaccharide export system permease protein
LKKLDQYIHSEIIRPLLVISLLLAGLFSSFNAARYLEDAVTQTLGLVLILELILLKTIIAMEVLLPIAFYAAIIVALGRMHRDQEIIVLQSAGINETRIVKTVLTLAIPVGLLVGLLSMYGRPWAYDTIYRIDNSASTELDVDRYQSGRFYGNETSGRIIYIKNKSNADKTLEGVFHYIRKDEQSDIILAHQGYQVRTGDFQPPQLHLIDGSMYRIGRPNARESIIHFSRFVFMPDTNKVMDYQRKAAPTLQLSKSTDSRDIAEFQWRISRAVATILLALVAIPLSRAAPRQGKGEKIIAAAVMFAIYYNLNGLAQTWVEQGIVGRVPGVWWLHILMLLLVTWVLTPSFRKKPASANVHT